MKADLGIYGQDEWRIVPNRSTRVLAFAAGEFDLTQTADITPPLLKDLKTNAPRATCSMLPTNVTTHMLVNRERPPFDNPELRRAMLLSLLALPIPFAAASRSTWC